MTMNHRLMVRLYDNNLTTPKLIQDLSDKVENLVMQTQLNGGFGLCQFIVGMRIQEAWNWLSTENRRGYHFNRLLVSEDQNVIWEGRIISVELQVQRNKQGVKVIAQGYWGSTQDQYYTSTGNTNWSSGSGHQVHDIIKEMLTEECPDINSDQTNIADTTRDLAGINLAVKEYPQTRINELLRLGDSDGSVWFFAIWEDRKPYLFKRAATTVDWYVWLDDLQDLRLEQQANDLRNAVLPFVGTTEGTTVTDASSLLLFPRREMKWDLPTGTNSNTQADAATVQAGERGLPRQAQAFKISGRIYRATGAVGATGRLEESPKWRVRAGDVIRIQDLVPVTAATPALDDVRTFYIMETKYDANADVLSIQPDRRSRRITRTLRRLADQNR